MTVHNFYLIRLSVIGSEKLWHKWIHSQLTKSVVSYILSIQLRFSTYINYGLFRKSEIKEGCLKSLTQITAHNIRGPSRRLFYFMSSSLHHKYTKFTEVQKWLMNSTHAASSVVVVSYTRLSHSYLSFPPHGLECEMSSG